MGSRAAARADDTSRAAPPEAGPPRATAPSFRRALAFWLKLGCISFGGPAGQIAIMHRELVEQRRWIGERRFLHALNYCMLLPGPEAQQLATYIGWLMHGVRGGIAAGALFVLPSFVVLVGLAWLYVAHGTLPLVAGVFYGLKPAVVALVLHAAHRIGRRTLTHPGLVAIAAAAFVALRLGAPFPLLIGVAALLGAIGARVAPTVFAPRPSGVSAAAAEARQAPALIDDAAPPPPHARHSAVRFAGVVGTGLVLWAGLIGSLLALFGPAGTLTRMAWFFTKAALLTFGGAYAVLPYVVQGAVEQHQWIGATQMIDGLALGETTPGPLIMVVTFIGFVGGWFAATFGAEARFAAGLAAAAVVTAVTFLPSFVFILTGGPLVEATHGRLGFTAPLTAITAAVVGVIVNLALFFAGHVLWPQGLAGPIDLGAAAIALGAAIALFRFGVGVLPLLAACAAAGVLLQALPVG
ncbi:chromate efflux transporter [Schlegelella koreensis]|uniref:Chromate efflux transporter n=1 Tax=Piscinibacter koreensis TaxID=2742824 RepID=A0A7Y6NKK1_9BURK|nr:chromate efflux transporter [Schlegelella koreensis]NUZ04814.1 chromate efflux transporter [Schlegelella koreensis]